MSASDPILEGGCVCGATRYRLLESPMIVHACHCRDCQKLTGAWHAVNALIETRAVDLLSGELVQTELPTPSGAGQTVSRCRNCGVALWSNYHRLSRGRGDIIRFVRVGTLDRPELLPPDVHIFDATRNSCSPQEADKPRFPGFYKLQEVWSRASLQRFAALIGPQETGLQAAATGARP